MGLGPKAVVCEFTSDDSTTDTLIADLRVQGVWESQVDTIFDVHVIDTDAPSYLSHPPQVVLQSVEAEKNGSILLLVKLVMPVSSHYVLVLMGCLVMKPVSFCDDLLNFWPLSGMNLTVWSCSGQEQGYHLPSSGCFAVCSGFLS